MTNITTDRVGHPGDRTLTMSELRTCTRAVSEYDSLIASRRSMNSKSSGFAIALGATKMSIGPIEFQQILDLLIDNRVTHLTSLGIKVGPIGLVTPEHGV